MTKTILLVEDDPQDEKLILRALKKVNLANTVEVARDGQQALDYLFQEGEFSDRKDIPLPTMVILDINLPRVNGLEVLSRLRQDAATKLLPIIMLTSSDDEQDLIQSYKDGANSFVRKPIDFGEFAETVATLGIYWLATNIAPKLSVDI